MLTLIIILLLGSFSALAKCSDSFFCGTSSVSEKSAKINMISNIYSNIKYDFNHKQNDLYEKTVLEHSVKLISPIVDVKIKKVGKLFYAKVSKEKYLKVLRREILDLEKSLKENLTNKIVIKSKKDTYNNYLAIYNIYASDKINQMDFSIKNKLTFKINSEDKKLKLMMENFFEGKGMISSENNIYDLVITLDDQSSTKIINYNKIVYNMNINVNIKSNKNAKTDFFNIEKTFIANSKNEIDREKNKYLTFLINK
jgi:hypothetical protein